MTRKHKRKRPRFPAKHGKKIIAGNFEIEFVKDGERRLWVYFNKCPRKVEPKEKRRRVG